MHIDVASPKRREKCETLDVIQMKMRQDDVEFPNAFPLADCAQTSDSRPRIENNERPVGRADLNAGRIASVADCVRSGTCNRPATAPDSRVHGLRIPCGGLLPEDGEHADEFVGVREKRKSRHCHDSLPAVKPGDA
jgi:hypothetical protein